MDQSPNWSHYITIILYQLHKFSEPISHVDFFLEKHLPEPVDLKKVLADIEEGLGSNVEISKILPGPHNEKLVREFFATLAKKIKSKVY